MPSLGDQVLTNARLVDGGAKVILVIFVFYVVFMFCCFYEFQTAILQVPFLSAAVWRDGETLEDELMEAVMTDKVTTIIILTSITSDHSGSSGRA